MEHISKILDKAKQPASNDSKPESQNASSAEPGDSAECPICHDVGWLYPRNEDGGHDSSQVIRCSCMREKDDQEKQERLLKLCALPARTEHKTLDKFKTFGDRGLVKALEYARKVADGSEDIIFFSIFSESNRGKSHLGIGICREWLARKQAARYVNVARMINELRSGYEQDSEYTFQSRLDFFCHVGLLVLDDFGAERITDWGAEQLQSIVNARYDDALHTVVTSNRPIDDLFNIHDYRADSWREFANMRIKSRLEREAWCQIVILDCPEYGQR